MTAEPCPCGADHCRVCGALDWRVSFSRPGPALYCNRCGSPEGVERDAEPVR